MSIGINKHVSNNDTAYFSSLTDQFAFTASFS